MYPDCPYQAAWKPVRPDGTEAGGAIPGPVELTQAAAAGAAPTSIAETRTAAAIAALENPDLTARTLAPAREPFSMGKRPDR